MRFGARSEVGSALPHVRRGPVVLRHPGDLELAKSLCAECPLRVECLAGALERAEPWGVRGARSSSACGRAAPARNRGRYTPVKSKATACAGGAGDNTVFQRVLGPGQTCPV